MTTEQMDAVDATGKEKPKPEPAQAHIFAAIRAVMGAVRGVAKSGEMKANAKSPVQYNFQRYDDMAERIGAAFRDQGVMTQSVILDKGRDSWDKPNDYGKVTRWTSAWVHKRFIFTSLVDGTSVQVEAIGEGADSSDKAFNKAQTAAYKVAFKVAFTLSTKDDVDPDSTRPEIPGEITRNNPWSEAEAAVAEATRREVSGDQLPQFTDDQRAKVAKAYGSLSNASTTADLEKLLAWASGWHLLDAPVPNGGTLAGALLAAKGTVAP
jgi:hypothetical protein